MQYGGFYAFCSGPNKLIKRDMIAIDKELIQVLFDKALVNPCLREGYDLRNSKDEGCQRMLLALMSRTVVPIHRHPHSNKNVVVVCGKMAYVLYDDNAQEIERILLDPAVGQYGCDISANAWHTVEVMEPTIMYEAKAGKYGADGSETLEDFKGRISHDSSPESFSNTLGDLKKNIEYLIGMERQSGSMDTISPLYVSRMLNVPLEDVEKAMKKLGVQPNDKSLKLENYDYRRIEKASN